MMLLPLLLLQHPPSCAAAADYSGFFDEALGVYVPPEWFADSTPPESQAWEGTTFLSALNFGSDLLHMIVREVYKVDMLSQWDYSGQLTDALLDQLKLCYQTYFVGDKDYIWVPIFPVWSIADLTSRKSYYDCGIVFDVREAMKPLTIATVHRRHSKWHSRNLIVNLPPLLVEAVCGVVWRAEAKFGCLCTHHCQPCLALGAFVACGAASLWLSVHGMTTRRCNEVSACMLSC